MAHNNFGNLLAHLRLETELHGGSVATARVRAIRGFTLGRTDTAFCS